MVDLDRLHRRYTLSRKNSTGLPPPITAPPETLVDSRTPLSPLSSASANSPRESSSVEPGKGILGGAWQGASPTPQAVQRTWLAETEVFSPAAAAAPAGGLTSPTPQAVQRSWLENLAQALPSPSWRHSVTSEASLTDQPPPPSPAEAPPDDERPPAPTTPAAQEAEAAATDDERAPAPSEGAVGRFFLSLVGRLPESPCAPKGMGGGRWSYSLPGSGGEAWKVRCTAENALQGGVDNPEKEALRAELMRQGAKIRELQAQVEELTAAKAKTPREDAAGATPSRRRATGLFGAAGRKKSVLSRAQ
mmetsp:Transcript_30862/g.93994  ORF Transcript_30862/g.93994 Transcript_30862/m.93994 type:complete len:305 (+) Transcript_30862:56-970(+)